jgi:hypothetical protein
MSRPLKPIGSHLAITAIRMPPQLKTKLESLAYQTGLSQQEHIRRALDHYIDRMQEAGKYDPQVRKPARGVRRAALPTPPAPIRRIFRRPNGRAGAAA